MTRYAPLLLALGLLAATTAPEPPRFYLVHQDYTMRTSDTCFPTGLRWSFQEDHRQPVVAISTVVDSGWLSDPEGQEGRAHLLEHLWFRARPDGGATVAERIAAAGGWYNAETREDVTVFHVLAPASALPELIALEGARVADPLAGVTPEVLAQEREVVAAELRERGRFDWFDATATVDPLLYPPEHPYARNRAETPASVGRLSLEALRDYADAAFRSEHTTVTVTGDLQRKQMQALVEAQVPRALLFDEVLRDPPCPDRLPEARPAPPAPVRSEPLTVRADVPSPHLLVAWSLPPAYTEGDALAGRAVRVLESRLEERVAREWVGQAPETACHVQQRLQGSLALCVTSVPPRSSLPRVLEAFDDAMEWTATRSDLDADRVIQKATLADRHALFRGLQEISGVRSSAVTEAAIFNHLTGQPSWLRTTLRQMDSVVPRDVRRFAGEWLTPERRVTALLLPPGHPGLPDSVEAEEQDRADKAADAESSKPERGEEVDPLGEGGPHHRLDLADLAELPQGAADLASLAVDPDLSALRRFTLDSGLEVVLLPYGDVPTVEARLVLRGGEASEPAVGLHYATLAFTSFGDTGVPERSGEGARLLTYDEAALAVGGTLRMLMEDEALVFRMSAAAGNTDDQLYLLARLVSEAELLLFDMDAMDLAVEDLLKDVPPAADAYTWRMSRTMPGHPLAESAGAAGLRGSARRGSKEIKDWFRATYQPSNATLILVGDLDPEAVQAQVEQRFGVWPAPRKPTPPPADTPAAAPALPAAVAVFPGENPDLAELVASCRVAPETSPEALAVAARLLDAEVFDALRARSGLSYTPFADAVSAPGTSGMLVTWATVDAQRVDEALSTLDAVLAKLAAAPPEPALLDAALRAEANERVLQHLTTWQLSDLLLDTIHSGQEPEALLGTGARLAEVRAEHVQAAFQACQATRATSIVGPPEAVAGLASP